MRRVNQLEKSVLAAKDSPIKRFATGNLESLQVEGIRDHLLKYHTEHYASHLMSLCVVGNHSIEDLEKEVQKHFGDIEKKEDVKLKDFSQEPMYDETSLGHIIKFVPNKDSKLMTIKWPNMPPIRDMWNGSPLQYLSHSLGDEGENSLLSELIR